jgi:hypothetical protein
MVGMKAALICPSTRFTWAMSLRRLACSALPEAMALKAEMKEKQKLPSSRLCAQEDLL